MIFKDFIANINFNDEAYFLKKITASLDKDIKILDVGCGFGRNIKLFKSLGFNNIIGVDVNEEIIKINKYNEVNSVTLDEFQKKFKSQQFDLIIFSHIIEHFEHNSLKDFLEYYFKFLISGGRVLFSTPIFQESFFNDFDHVKPYYPIGIDMVFGGSNSQVQYYSRYELSLEDLYFYKSQFRLRFYRSLYLKSIFKLTNVVNLILNLLFCFSRGLIGEKVGWIGLYKVKDN